VHALAVLSLLLLFAAPPLSAQSVEIPLSADPVLARHAPVMPAVFFGTAGAGAGLLGGVVLGNSASTCTGVLCLGSLVLGGVVGATFGAATGAYFGTRLASGRPSFGRTVAGTVVGAGGGLLLGRALDAGIGSGAPTVAGFVIGAGAGSGIAAARWH
jgi:hypothetical protein